MHIAMYTFHTLNALYFEFLVKADVEAMQELTDELPTFDETVKQIQKDTESEEASMHQNIWLPY